MDTPKIENPLAKKVLLIGWDGADWEHITPLLEEGLLPTLEGMINRGVKGNLATLQPILSPMLWNSVATGKLADKHGIHGFAEPNPAGGARPYTSFSRKCKALWNIFTQLGMKSNVVSWWASHPAEPINGCIVSNSFNATKLDPHKGWQIPPGTVHPEDKAAFLAEMRVLPVELTHEHVLPFIPEGAKIDQENDRRLQSFGKVLSDCSSIHAVATTIMETEPWDFMAVYYDAVDHFSHAFMQYHPPQMEKIEDDAFVIYKDVIKGAYRFHDMMLERLLQLAGDDCTVILCSDHGFQSRGLRPKGVPREPAGPAIWHREMGIVVMQGPGIKRDELIYGASLIDMAPTVLTLFGLPIGEDMDGRPLVEAFERPIDISTIPSWEDVPGECGMHPPGAELDEAQSDDLMKQFVALGYIDDTGDDKEEAADNAVVEAQYNIARTYQWSNRPDQAREIMEELVHHRPWETRFLNMLARCYRDAGYHKQAIRLIDQTYPDELKCPAAILLLKGRAHFGLRDVDKGLELVLKAEAADPQTPGLYVQIGNIYLRLRRYDEAERAFKKAIALHDDSAAAHQGLSSVYLRRRKAEDAADEALAAVGLLHRLPIAHFNLGVAMARLGWPERAEQAFKTTLRIRPTHLPSYRMLVALYRQELDNQEAVAYHKTKVEMLMSTRFRRDNELAQRRDQLFDLPPIPGPEERFETLDRERPVRGKEPEKSGKTVVLVSGLPRSGTSLMMQMLAAGGLPPKTDGQRVADSDNPEGYYEWESIKQVAKQPDLLDEEGLDGKAIKVISMLLRAMPAHHDYKVIFMTRPTEEIAASQAKMIDRLGTGGAELARDELVSQLRGHRHAVLRWLKRAKHIQLLEVDYPSLVASPDEHVPQIVDFIGRECLPQTDQMVNVVRPELHRQRIPERLDHSSERSR